ncbi:MAG: lytic transglycosylase domain-containing protein [Deltaproteobacteria bacterium]|jgi:membrane-bound lytic murein transglycosylase D|nr:lytic transglycosylase domain-containing protein [Deltaproteobacteria bacterium]
MKLNFLYGKIFFTLFFLIFASCSSIHEVFNDDDEVDLARVKSPEEIKRYYGSVNYYPDMELVRNSQVQKFIDFYTKKPRTIKVSLERRISYEGVIESLFHQFGVPETLINVALVESNFNPNVKSHAGAGGMWQFMPYTAQKYGLVVNDTRDDRLNVELSTKAACMYLVDLYHKFDDWYLALAAYNAGPARVRRAINEGKSRDYFTLVRKGLLSKENSEFVARVIAVTVITRSPDKYGIKIAKLPNYDFKKES